MKNKAVNLLLLLSVVFNHGTVFSDPVVSEDLMYQDYRQRVSDYRRKENLIKYVERSAPLLKAGKNLALQYLGNPIAGVGLGGALPGIGIDLLSDYAAMGFASYKESNVDAFQETAYELQNKIVEKARGIDELLTSSDPEFILKKGSEIFVDNSKINEILNLSKEERKLVDTGFIDQFNEARKKELSVRMLDYAEKAKKELGKIDGINLKLKKIKSKLQEETDQLAQDIKSVRNQAEKNEKAVINSYLALNSSNKKLEGLMSEMLIGDPVSRIIEGRMRVLRASEQSETNKSEVSYLKTISSLNEGVDAVNEYVPMAQFLVNVGAFDARTSQDIGRVINAVSSIKNQILPALAMGGVGAYFLAANVAIALFSPPQRDVKHEMYMESFKNLLQNQQVMNQKLDVLLEGQDRLFKQSINILAQISSIKILLRHSMEANIYNIEKNYKSIYDFHKNYQIDEIGHIISCLNITKSLNTTLMTSADYQDFQNRTSNDKNLVNDFDKCFFDHFQIYSKFNMSSVFYEAGVTHLNGNSYRPSTLANVFSKMARLTFDAQNSDDNDLTGFLLAIIPALDLPVTNIYDLNAKFYEIKEGQTNVHNFRPNWEPYNEFFVISSEHRGIDSATISSYEKFGNLYNAKLMVDWVRQFLNYVQYYPFLDTKNLKFADFHKEINETRIEMMTQVLKDMLPYIEIAIKQQTLLSGDALLYEMYNRADSMESRRLFLENEYRVGKGFSSFTYNNYEWQLATRMPGLFNEEDTKIAQDIIEILKESPLLRANFSMYSWHRLFESNPSAYKEFYESLADPEVRRNVRYKMGFPQIFTSKEYQQIKYVENSTLSSCGNSENWIAGWTAHLGATTQVIEELPRSFLKDASKKEEDILRIFKTKVDTNPILGEGIGLCLPTPEEFKQGVYYSSPYISDLANIKQQVVEMIAELEMYYDFKFEQKRVLPEGFYLKKLNILKQYSTLKSNEIRND